ncbi:MAG: peptidase S10 [Cyanobacteriota bacterium]|nr:peptidase S10 [Cyanobacteriota bacterium]
MSQNEKTENAQKSEDKDKKRQLLGIEPVETEGELVLPTQSYKYKTRAGVLPLKDEFGETQAEIFFTAYEYDIANPADRPLTFVFNGGPGSSSVWLHMGALGPKRVCMEKEGWMPAPPYRLEDNPYTWLDRTDLVFVDPVGTGYSRAIDETTDKKYWSFAGDIQSVGEFVRLYLSRYQRTCSPLYLAGESYGTTRVAGLAGDLVKKGIAFNGIILISTALDLRPIFFATGDDLPFVLFVPTYAATAWYHKKLDAQLQRRPLPELMAEVEAWSEGELTLALMKGDRLLESERCRIAEQLARYTGLSVEFVLGSNLRVNIDRFCKQLLRETKRSVGRLDSRFLGIEPSTVTDRPEFDPSMYAIIPPYTATFEGYVRSELGIETDLTYKVISWHTHENWEWEKGTLPTTGEVLRGAMAKNPYMKVFVAQGYYDLATPHFATEYMISHMNIDPELRRNVEVSLYEAGHMFYLDVESLAAFKKDIDGFLVQ